ncbi:MAG TPA: DUF4136 domain-containing protein [Allosphingosinicella sp.]|jgi:hypothetical protein
MKKYAALALVATAAILAGCESTGGGNRGAISVTPTHLGQPIARGEIRVEPGSAAANEPAFAQLIAPVERELSRLGWRLVPQKAASEQVAVVNIVSSAGTTGLRVRIQRRSDGSVAWQGLAEGPAVGGSYAERAALFDRLARALFQDFPGESGRTISVR